ncbi:hypothetical protein TNIN_431761 [Trichonephila inaurata madagascariensis]|uniref:Uncharacterized protein n=1 Tax=Trichonephila inaurata madagascariensis TaxID=2747483 RepID=A0A8X6X2I4_9ARAC|nr:hypothetical protein TNIN_431761 [Trichonephila inaurata madagascariensis]
MSKPDAFPPAMTELVLQATHPHTGEEKTGCRNDKGRGSLPLPASPRLSVLKDLLINLYRRCGNRSVPSLSCQGDFFFSNHRSYGLNVRNFQS